MLSVKGLSGGYGRMQILSNIDLEVPAGACVAVLGPNGAGKTTFLRTVFGLERLWTGEVRFRDRAVSGRPTHHLAQQGMALVPEGRHLFNTMTVHDNLAIAAEHAGTAGRTWTLDEVYALFPILRERADVESRRMSGGEQQMLAIGRSLMLAPALIALDEPSTGLAPRIVRQVLDVVRSLTDAGVGVLLVEQNAREVVRVADTVNILNHGTFTWSGSPAELEDDRDLRSAYLGLG
jgi:branched-chain amino acid transport system ATP-binding protein